MCKTLLAGLAALFFPIFLHAQAVSPVTPKLATFTVGGYFSYGQMDYGQHHNLGIGGYSDFDYYIGHNIGVGLEGEARFLNFHTKSGVTESNYLGGPRITYAVGTRWIPYVKALFGGSRFNYADSITPHGQAFYYTTYVGGGGVDFKLNDRWTIRPVDFEYQHWDFPPTGLTPWVYSAGLSYRLF